MAVVNPQIGWGQEAKLLQTIIKYLEKLIRTVAASSASFTGLTDTELRASPLDVTETDPLNDKYVLVNIVDTTNVGAGSTYYPSSTGMSNDGYKDNSITGKLIIGVGNTITLTVEATNDETLDGSTDWIQIFGFDTKNNTTANSWGVTNGTLTFAVDFDNINYSRVRFKINSTSNINTAIIKMRRKAL